MSIEWDILQGCPIYGKIRILRIFNTYFCLRTNFLFLPQSTDFLKIWLKKCNLLDFDDFTYGDIDLFTLMGQLTDNGHEEIVESFKKQVLEFYQIAISGLKQLPFNDPILT